MLVTFERVDGIEGLVHSRPYGPFDAITVNENSVISHERGNCKLLATYDCYSRTWTVPFGMDKWDVFKIKTGA